MLTITLIVFIKSFVGFRRSSILQLRFCWWNFLLKWILHRNNERENKNKPLFLSEIQLKLFVCARPGDTLKTCGFTEGQKNTSQRIKINFWRFFFSLNRFSIFFLTFGEKISFISSKPNSSNLQDIRNLCCFVVNDG